MKKPLNYRLQMYRALVETMCTICWFRWIFCGFVLFFAHLRAFYAESSYLCSLKIVNVVIRCKSMRRRTIRVISLLTCLLDTRQL